MENGHEEKKLRGRPRGRWNDGGGAYLKDKRLGWREADTLAQDRTRWRRKIKEGNN